MDAASEQISDIWMWDTSDKKMYYWVRGPGKSCCWSLWYPCHKGFLCSPPQELWLTNSPSSSSFSPSVSPCMCTVTVSFTENSICVNGAEEKVIHRKHDVWFKKGGRRWVKLAEFSCRQRTHMHESRCIQAQMHCSKCTLMVSSAC